MQHVWHDCAWPNEKASDKQWEAGVTVTVEAVLKVFMDESKLLMDGGGKGKREVTRQNA